jgi:predicted dehydrogenase
LAGGGLKVAVLGGGWPGGKHVEGYRAVPGFKVVAVADLIPDRRDKLVTAAGGQVGAVAQPNAVRAYDTADALLADKALQLDVVSVCLPNDLHLATVTAALKRGCHVVCEPPPANTAKAAEQMAKAAAKAGRTLLYAFQRRFGGAEQAARLAIDKGYAGTPYHARRDRVVRGQG